MSLFSFVREYPRSRCPVPPRVNSYGTMETFTFDLFYGAFEIFEQRFERTTIKSIKFIKYKEKKEKTIRIEISNKRKFPTYIFRILKFSTPQHCFNLYSSNVYFLIVVIVLNCKILNENCINSR